MTTAAASAALLACAATVSCGSFSEGTSVHDPRPEPQAAAAPGGGQAPQAPGAAPAAHPAQVTRASAPDFSLQSTEGRTVHLSDYLGKDVVLIDFWSTTCDPCMAEMPYLVDLYRANKGKGFVVLAVSLDGPESLADVNRVVHDKEMVFPVLLDQETTVVARYNPKREMPFSVLIDRSGAIVEKKAGYTPGDEKVLAAAVEKMLP